MKLQELLILSEYHFHKSQVATLASMSALLSNRNKEASATAWGGDGFSQESTPEIGGGCMAACGADLGHPRWRGICWRCPHLSPMKKTAGTKGKELSPVLGMGGKTGALLLQMDALCSPNTESRWGSPLLLTVLPQTDPHNAPPGLPRVLGSPGERALAAAAQEAASQLERVNSSPQPPHDDG